MSSLKLYQPTLFLSILILFFLRPDSKSSLDPNLIAGFSICMLTFLFWHLYMCRKLFKGNWLRIDSFFILGFFIVHFQWPIMFGISGITPERIHRVWGSTLYVNYGVWLSLVGGLCWLYGYSFFKIKTKTREQKYKFYYKKLLTFTVVIFIMFLATAGRDFLSGGVYKGTTTSPAGGGISAYIQILFSISIILLTLFVILENKEYYNGQLLKWIFKLDKSFLLLSGSYIILFFLIGDRGGPLALIITSLILIGVYVRPFKLSEFIFLITFGAILMTIIGLGRANNEGQGTLISGYNSLELNSYYTPTEQLANSIRTLFYSIENVDLGQNFFYGKLLRSSLMSPVPFLQSTYLDLTNEKDYLLSTSTYITYLVYGENPTSGEGTTLIADIYLNFGLIGIIIGMFLIGVFMKKLNLELMLERNFKWIIAAAFVASFSFYFGRTSFFVITRPIVWSLIITYFLVKIKKVNFYK